jgi:hypothetical protein
VEPRHHRVRELTPPLELVAVEAIKLNPESNVAKYLRAVPAVGDRMLRLRALHDVDQLAADPPLGEAERLAGLRHGVSRRSLRRWRTGRALGSP